MAQARNNSDTAPLALWLTGGPGCSSELAVFVENGPYQLNDKGEVEEREFAWDVEVSHRVDVQQCLLCSNASCAAMPPVPPVLCSASHTVQAHCVKQISKNQDSKFTHLGCATLQANMIFVDSPLNVGFSYTEVGRSSTSA